MVLLRWRRSSEDELVTAMATAEVRAELGCRCGEEDGAEIGKRGAGWRGVARAGAGGDEGAPRRVVACADRPAATRGRFPRHAARGV